MEPRDRVISMMYEAATNPQLWPVALDALANGTRARGANLEVHDRQASDFWGFMGGLSRISCSTANTITASIH